MCSVKCSRKPKCFSETNMHKYFILVLTALDLYVAKLSVHWKILKVHWTGRGNGQTVKHKSSLS
jgi:hypothetical protein